MTGFTLDDALRKIDAEWQCIMDLRIRAKHREEGPLVALAAQAREMGATWEQIGSILNMTRQAAQQRFGGYTYNWKTGKADPVTQTLTGPPHVACPRRCGGMGERVGQGRYICNECGEEFSIQFPTPKAGKPAAERGWDHCPRCGSSAEHGGGIFVCEGCGLTWREGKKP